MVTVTHGLCFTVVTMATTQVIQLIQDKYVTSSTNITDYANVLSNLFDALGMGNMITVAYQFTKISIFVQKDYNLIKISISQFTSIELPNWL